MPSLRASLLARHSAHDAELTRRRRLVLAGLTQHGAAAPARPFYVMLWQELFTPFRPAWAALACVWLVLLGFAASDQIAQGGASPSTETLSLAAWSERERALAALLAPSPPVVLNPPRGMPTSFFDHRRTSTTTV